MLIRRMACRNGRWSGGMQGLHVWRNGEHVGCWHWGRRVQHSFTYSRAWLASPAVRPLSLSLPIPIGEPVISGPEVRHYFDNLLPDNLQIRERVRQRFGLRGTDAETLLQAIGRDCVGAVQLLPEGMEPIGFDRTEGAPLSGEDIESLLRNLTRPVLGQRDEALDDFRISIAGAQEKTALLRVDGQWMRPLGATPTTHIFKLPLGLVANLRFDLSDSVENEWLCSRLLAALGLPVAQTDMARFGDQRVLVVERFDRRRVSEGRWIARLPQEDFCQATGMPAERKYERDGGPGMNDILRILAAGSHPMEDGLVFALSQFAFWLLAAIDGHAKNFSIFLEPGGRYRMTPLYDVLSAWPVIGAGAGELPYQKARLAMAVRAGNTHFRLADIQPRHWERLLRSVAGEEGLRALHEFVARVEPSLETVEAELPADFPAQVWGSVRHGVRRQLDKVRAAV